MQNLKTEMTPTKLYLQAQLTHTKLSMRLEKQINEINLMFTKANKKIVIGHAFLERKRIDLQRAYDNSTKRVVRRARKAGINLPADINVKQSEILF